ncbi:lipopolysaccharide biosynthesis protein [Vibrio cholerae]|uniref:acyltransferase n=1 Tax=Vibrio cholerae TaxID=666 RepID=UPI00096BB7BC|nr:acyltransferase [Vibrio cholerae]MBO1385602.1 lipopolysaccharide biosynthesis protein [Vibrio cholerae]WOQ90040.1 acyltransferase [Vibrio cholerae]
MMYKLKWALSALIMFFFCKSIKYPSYFAWPLFSRGLSRVTIGRYVRIFPNLRIETHFSGLINIDDNVSIAQNVHITSAGEVNIGSGTVVNANSFITSIDHDYSVLGLDMARQKFIVRDTNIGKNCFIGMGVAIQAGTTLGDHVIVGSNSVVRGCFPSYCVIAGAPAKIIKRYDPNDSLWKRTDAFGNFI